MSLQKIANGITRDDMPGIGLITNIKRKSAESKEENILEMAEKQESALIVFVRCYLSIIRRACPTESIARGFILNGIIDTASLSSPNISMMLNTYKKTNKGCRPINPSSHRHSHSDGAVISCFASPGVILTVASEEERCCMLDKLHLVCMIL